MRAGIRRPATICYQKLDFLLCWWYFNSVRLPEDAFIEQRLIWQVTGTRKLHGLPCKS